MAMSAAPLASIAWIGDPLAPAEGQWGEPAGLAVPLDDRGLLLADGLFETLLLEGGRIQLLDEHLERWRQGAALLGLPPPPPAGPLRELVAGAVARSGIRTGALRFNASRGSAAGRGLDLPSPAEHRPRFWLQLSPIKPAFTPLAAIISQRERRNPASLLSRCKTFAYGGQVQARREAREAGADEALMLAISGELSCGAAANLLVRRRGIWLTPPLSSGCLPGVMRGRALALGWAREEPLAAASLVEAEAVLLINSLGCRPLRRCDGLQLPAMAAAAAEALFRTLLVGDAAQVQPWTEMR
jgi:branched-subunit amino acid aminotransferase/4-amino-4-deoxychorismate lyase